MPGLWQTVCGKVDSTDQYSVNACHRETLEETGFDIQKHRIKLIFNDEYFNCDVYITQIQSQEESKWTEPDKMSKWKTVNKNDYIKLAKSNLMTSIHVRKYEKILQHIQEDIACYGTWEHWENNNDPLNDLEIYNNAGYNDEWQPEPYKDPFENTNYREEYHIFRGSKWPYKRCDEKKIIIHILYASNVNK